jgi:hypothetical protein
MSSYERAVKLVTDSEEKEAKLVEWDSFYFTFLISSTTVNEKNNSILLERIMELGYVIDCVELHGKKIDAKHFDEISILGDGVEVDFRRNFRNIENNKEDWYTITLRVSREKDYLIVQITPLGKRELFNEWVANEWLHLTKHVIAILRPLYGYLDVTCPSSLMKSKVDFLIAKYKTQAGFIPCVVVYGPEILEKFRATESIDTLRFFSIEKINDNLFIVLDPFWISAVRYGFVKNESRTIFEQFLHRVDLKKIFFDLEAKK